MSRLISLALAALLPAAAFAQTDTSTNAPASASAAPATATPAAPATPAQPAVPAPQPQKRSAGPAPTAQQAQEDAGDTSELARDIGPLKSRIPPVTGHLFMMRHRFELTPLVGVSLRDAFFTKYLAGAELTYHLTEDLGIGARVSYAKSTISGAAQICTNEGATRGCTSPTMGQVDGNAPGQISMLGGINLQWAPIYGKISLLAEKFVHFDIYGVFGVAGVQYVGPGTDSPPKLFTVGANVGAGARLYLNRWMALRGEFRDLIYAEKVSLGPDSLRNQLVFELGLSFFFPMSFGES